MAKLLNKEGKVVINGKERDFRDVFSYDKLKDLGLIMPEEAETTSTRFIGASPVIDPSVNYNVVLTTSKVTYNSRRMMWVTLRGLQENFDKNPNIKVKVARIDVCWRKKGWLGWYNGKLYGYPTIVTMNKAKFPLDKKYEYSPMKFVVMKEYTSYVSQFPANSPLDLYIRFESKEKYADFTAVYPANLKKILELNNGAGDWERFVGMFKDPFFKIAGHYAGIYATQIWNNKFK